MVAVQDISLCFHHDNKISIVGIVRVVRVIRVVRVVRVVRAIRVVRIVRVVRCGPRLAPDKRTQAFHEPEKEGGRL